MAEVGNPRVVPITLAAGVPYVWTPTGGTRACIIHERSNGLDLLIGTESGGIAAGKYLTLAAGNYLQLSAEEQLARLYFQCAAIATVEVLFSDSLVGLAAGYTP